MSASDSLRYENRQTSELPLPERGKSLWHRSAPERVIRAGRWDEGSKGWRLWQQHLLVTLDRKFQLTGNPAQRLFWSDNSTPFKQADKRIRKFASGNHSGETSDQLSGLFAFLERCRSTPLGPLECLDWAYSLPQLAQSLTAHVWWALLDRFIEIAADANSLSLEDTPTEFQLLAGELPLTLAYLFPEIKRCRQLAKPGAEVISHGILELSNDDGTLHASYLSELRPLMACWTRSRLLGAELKQGKMRSAASERLVVCAQQALRLLTPKRLQLLHDSSCEPWPAPLLAAALASARKKPASVARAGAKASVPPKKSRLSSSAESSWQSDSSEYAVLRSQWTKRATLLAVDYSSPTLHLQLNTNQDAVCHGPWRLDITFNDERCELLQDWDSVCWVADEDVAYLELQGSFSHDLKVQRQVLLGRQDDFLFLNDVLLSPTPGRLGYRSALPCEDGIVFQPAVENREFKLIAPSTQLLALPLALPEWQSQPASGEFLVRGKQLEYSLTRQGTALSAPWFIDLKQKKREQPYTWRPLTVAENRQILSAEDAVAYRVQVGQRQFLFYRSLSTRGTRTVLGAHLANEFLASRLNDDGDLHTLVEIE